MTPVSFSPLITAQLIGAAPINWAVIHGEKETGVTTFFLTHGVDTGRIIRQRKIAVAETDNAGIVHDKLMVVGAALVLETVNLIVTHEGHIDTISQENLFHDSSALCLAPKIYKDTCRINWQQPAKAIYNFIRGLSPYPAAWTALEMPDETCQSLKIFETTIVSKIHPSPAGTIITDSKTFLDIATEDDHIRLLSIQLSGKKRLPVKEFLQGIKSLPDMIRD